MSDDDRINALEAHLEQQRQYDRHMRGELIYVAVVTESMIEQIIAVHFCGSESTPLFISLMFSVGQITFSQKLQILKKLFKVSYPDFLTIFPKMFSALERLREVRNKLAHSKEGSGSGEFKAFLLGEIDSFPRGTRLEYFKDGEKKGRVYCRRKD